VDIRTVPRSGQNPQFNSNALDCVLSAETIQYVPLLAARRPAACPQGY
jgi:hypothetical protein